MQIKQSLSKSSTRLLTRNKNVQSAIGQMSEIQKYDTNKLFDEFKRHLLRQDKKGLNKNVMIDNGYKDLLGELRKGNEEKRRKVHKMESKLKTVGNVGCQSKVFKEINNQQGREYVFVGKEQSGFRQNKQSNLHLSACKSSQSNCKFKPIRPMTTEHKFRINNNSKSRLDNFNSKLLQQTVSTMGKINRMSIGDGQPTITQAQVYANRTLQQISQSSLMVQMEQSRLNEEISSLKQSLNKLTKLLTQANKDLEIQTRNQQKYKHITYLATSIQNQTDTIKLQNLKGYNTMAYRQEDTLAQLKRFKMNLRKEKDEMEGDYIEDINQIAKLHEEKHAYKKRQFLFSSNNNTSSAKNLITSNTSNTSHPKLKFQLLHRTIGHESLHKTNESSLYKSQGQIASKSNSKSVKRLIDQLDSIVGLLQHNQTQFEHISESECTKVRLGKINKTLLSKQRVDILERIEQFEAKYDMKIVSAQSLILKWYHSLTHENQQLESQCLALTTTKQQLLQQLKTILKKHSEDLQYYEQHAKSITQQLEARRKLNVMIKKSSTVFLKIVQVLHNLLFKFRYMFSLALTLDIDKKSFRDTVVQIDSLFSSGMFFNFNLEKHLITSSQRHDVINEKEFKQILLYKNIGAELSQQLTDIMFNDHRVNLTVHKSWVENKLNCFSDYNPLQQSDVLDMIESLRVECYDIYNLKLPSLTCLFMTCFKSLMMTKYESKLAASSNQRGSIFLPTRPHKKLHYLQFIDDNNESVDKDSEKSMQQSKKNIVFESESSNLPQMTFQKDPRRVIYNLQHLKNQGNKKFKLLNFACEGKTYQYNQQIIIPDFPMIEQCEDF